MSLLPLLLAGQHLWLRRMTAQSVDPAVLLAVQFQRLEAFHELPGGSLVDAATEATLLGTDVETLRGLRSGMQEIVDQSADALMRRPEVRSAVNALPEGLSVACVGDSLTADHQSWAEMLQRVLATLRPDVSLTNLAKSGDTTLDTVRRLNLVMGLRSPSIFVVMIGSNDACRTIPFPGTTFLSDEGTSSNLQRITDIIASREGRLLWVTPPPISEKSISEFTVFAQMGIGYWDDDVATKAGLVRARAEPVVDLWSAFDGQPLESLLLSDGLHLGADGQMAVAELVCLALADVASPAGGLTTRTSATHGDVLVSNQSGTRGDVA